MHICSPLYKFLLLRIFSIIVNINMHLKLLSLLDISTPKKSCHLYTLIHINLGVLIHKGGS